MRLLLLITAILQLIPSPSALAQSTTPPVAEAPQRLLFVIPNNRTVEHRNTFSPISARTKWKLAAEDAFDPYAFLSAGVNAAAEQATNDHAQYGQGFRGFAKRYGADFTDEATSELLGGGVFPVLFHQDPRYFRMERGGIRKRSMYALSRSVWTKTDSGATQFNISNVLGGYTAASISNVYYPAADRTFGQTMQRGSILLFEDAAFNLIKEFWPDVHQRLRQKRSKPEPPTEPK